MKHNTHIYLAAKAIEFTREGVSNTRDTHGDYLTRGKKSSMRLKAKQRQRLLDMYEQYTAEASWAPDDILRDNKPFHIFKLFTNADFPGHGLTDKQQYTIDHNIYYKLSGEDETVIYYKYAGGLPFRVDHIAQTIIEMSKLRNYNDRFAMQQIMYQLLLLSHYIADAHVPMHCDLRDDPPTTGSQPHDSQTTGTNKPAGNYMQDTAHGHLEQLWDDAVTPLALNQNIIPKTLADQRTNRTALSVAVDFTLDDCERDGRIEPQEIADGELMQFMINVCIQSKIRCQRLFPINNPTQLHNPILEATTRDIFADCIGNLMSIWDYIWDRSVIRY
jgi:hypothetical protein